MGLLLTEKTLRPRRDPRGLRTQVTSYSGSFSGRSRSRPFETTVERVRKVVLSGFNLGLLV